MSRIGAESAGVGARDAAHALLESLVDGSLPAGAVIDEAAAARRLGIARPLAREALRQLIAAGFGAGAPRPGVRLALPEPERLRAAGETLAQLGADCAGLAARRMTARERLQAEALQAEAGEPMRVGDGPRFARLHDALMAQLGDGARNPMLAAAFLDHQARMAALTRLAFRGVGLIARAFEEQGELVRALARGDAAAAEQATIRLVEAVAAAGEAAIEAARAGTVIPRAAGG